MAGTMKDIAKMTGLGLATISSYVNGGNVREKNRIAIEKAIEEIGFEVNEVARGLKTKKTMTVGIIIPELNNIFCTSIIAGVEDVLRINGYASIVCDCRSSEELEKEAVSFLIKKQVDLIINMPFSKKGQHLKLAIDRKIPIVLLDRKIKGVDCDCVVVDNTNGAKMAVEKLIEKGHKNIGVVCGPDDISTAKERLHGYRLAFEDNGIPIQENLIAYGDYNSVQSGIHCFKKLVKENPDMTAVFITNYEMTVGAIIGLNELGISIPGDLSVIGFDNLEISQAVRPKLSIVAQPLKEIADNIANLALERLAGLEDDARIVTLQTEFIEGKSVCRL